MTILEQPPLDFEETTHADLLSGKSPWGGHRPGPRRQSLRESIKVDVAVIGGGITGAPAAEHLVAAGHTVAIIDREPPGEGSTRASTAMLQWETDTSFRDLTDLYGFEAARLVYQLNRSSVAGIGELVSRHGISCGFEPRPTLFLAAGETGEAELAGELALRQRADLPGRLVRRDDLKAKTGMDREAAILSPGSAQADPLLLAWSLLDVAVKGGARIIAGDALHFHEEGSSVIVELDGPHVVEAKSVVLATGYVMPHFVMPEIHSISSTYALATVPQQPGTGPWPKRALVCESAHPYLYLRATPDERIIIGGEDDDVVDPELRNAQLEDKVARLLRKLSDLLPNVDCRISHTWCGAFGETSDGLPLIGRVPGTRHVYAAYGYGGNGITFSYVASWMVASLMAGQEKPWFDLFALDRPDPLR